MAHKSEKDKKRKSKKSAAAKVERSSPLAGLPRSPLEPAENPELFFGLVAPTGTNLSVTTNALKSELERVNYHVEEIVLSKQIEHFLRTDYSSSEEKDRINSLMADGTRIREESKRGDAIALLGIMEVRRLRNLKKKVPKTKGVAYIFKSLKHQAEIETLRKTYGKGFFCISVYTPRASRVDALATRIATSSLSTQGARADAELLIEKDESEKGHPLGQNVKDAFPLADFFLDGRSKQKISSDLKRFVELLFSHPYHTPTKDEYGMYHAKSAAMRSADLGRQVGAAIATKDCDLIAVGCNDVPRAGGGLYWADDASDGRDFRKGIDPMQEQKEQILGELIDRLRKNEWLSEPIKNIRPDSLINSLLVGDKKHVLGDTLVMNLLEFGRSVHAEMAALTDAARRGVPVKNATLYSTTFPCHLCAKHIIAAGIDRVVYIEPYPKSKAPQLYEDSIAVDEKNSVPNKVAFEPFVGVAPRQYFEFFEATIERKDKRGRIVQWPENGLISRVKRFIDSYKILETRIVAEIIPEMAKSLKLQLTLID